MERDCEQRSTQRNTCCSAGPGPGRCLTIRSACLCRSCGPSRPSCTFRCHHDRLPAWSPPVPTNMLTGVQHIIAELVPQETRRLPRRTGCGRVNHAPLPCWTLLSVSWVRTRAKRPFSQRIDEPCKVHMCRHGMAVSRDHNRCKCTYSNTCDWDRSVVMECMVMGWLG